MNKETDREISDLGEATFTMTPVAASGSSHALGGGTVPSSQHTLTAGNPHVNDHRCPLPRTPNKIVQNGAS